MKGRTSFTAHEADQILRLLRAKARAERDEQKQIRAELRRRWGFYISDFPDTCRPFLARDFESLVARKLITVR